MFATLTFLSMVISIPGSPIATTIAEDPVHSPASLQGPAALYVTDEYVAISESVESGIYVSFNNDGSATLIVKISGFSSNNFLPFPDN